MILRTCDQCQQPMEERRTGPPLQVREEHVIAGVRCELRISVRAMPDAGNLDVCMDCALHLAADAYRRRQKSFSDIANMVVQS